eukprot:gene8081-12542_t
MPTKKLVIHGNYLSEPSRAVLWFCMINNIPHEFKNIDLSKFEHLKKDFAKKNPSKKIPFIEDKGVFIYEHGAILRYLCQKYNTPDHWYPSDPEKRAKVDMYLDWHHSNLRYGARNSVFYTFFAPMFHMDVPVEKMSEYEKSLKVALKRIDHHFLPSQKNFIGELEEANPEYIGGLYEVSIADLSCFSQISQLKLIDFDLSPYKNIQQWEKSVQQLPYFQNVHLALNRVYEKSKL